MSQINGGCFCIVKQPNLLRKLYRMRMVNDNLFAVLRVAMKLPAFKYIRVVVMKGPKHALTDYKS